MRNNPIRYSDPSGHRLVDAFGNGGCSTSGYCPGSSTYNPPPPSGGGGGNNNGGNNNGDNAVGDGDDNCKGLECISDHYNDDDITFPAELPFETPPSSPNCVAEVIAGMVILEGATVITFGGVILLGGTFVIGGMTFGLSVPPSTPVIVVGITMELIAAGMYMIGTYMVIDGAQCAIPVNNPTGD